MAKAGHWTLVREGGATGAGCACPAASQKTYGRWRGRNPRSMGFRRFLRAGKRPRRLKGAAAFSRKGKKEDKDMKKNGRLILAAVVVVLLVAVFAVIWFATRPATTEGLSLIHI